ncbi:hypothetical protein [Pseudosulfitobacter pseudonitzschiae]|uniref:hypothetical protein n=1 Tax=Pseudosulfitobacter pseudonitzschiae TaxID=1402135 RepID=UPI003B7BB24F
MEFILWHGTNQVFDVFDETMLGLHTYNPASKAAFFFAAHPDTAREYAKSASDKLLPNQVEHERKIEHLLHKAEQATHCGDFDGYERYILEAEELESAALQAPAWGGIILKCLIRVDSLTEVSGSDRQVISNFGDILVGAKNDGYEALVLRDIIDTPSGEGPLDTHLAVYDVSCIEILEKYEADDDLPFDPEAIPRDIFSCLDPFIPQPVVVKNAEMAL